MRGGTVVAKGCGKRSCIIELRPSSKEEGSRLCSSMWNNHPLSLVEAITSCGEVSRNIILCMQLLLNFLTHSRNYSALLDLPYTVLL